MHPQEWATAAKDFLNWSAPLLPLRLGWILVIAAGLFAAYKFLGLILRRNR